tara:strand:- start:342 stop:644 length:303 start_codon:yes stop_codon:yes gene_type:complete
MSSEEMVYLEYPRLRGLKSPCTAPAYAELRKELNKILQRHNTSLKDVQHKKGRRKYTDLQIAVVNEFYNYASGSVYGSFAFIGSFFNADEKFVQKIHGYK